MLSLRRLTIPALLVALSACASKPQVTQPKGAPPTPKSITRENPGGDADDPERAALERLLAEPWGYRRDFWNTLHVPLIDWKNWRRVRIFGVPMRAAYRYGDEHYAGAALWYETIEGPNDPEACLARFLDRAAPLAEANGVRLGERQRVRMTQSIDGESRPMALDLLEGRVDSIIARDDYAGAVAAYPSFPGTCLVHVFAVVSTRHHDLAIKIRDRWVAEGATELRWEKAVKEAPAPEGR